MPRPPVALKRRIAAELRALRERSGLTLEAAAQRAEVTKSSLSRFENGHSAPKIHTLRALMDLYHASEEQREELEQLTKEAARRGWSTSVFGEAASVPEWLRTYVGLEATAVSLRIRNMFIPGLFQTPEYARAVIAANGNKGIELERRLRLRISRQALLRGENAPKVHVLLDEGALHRKIGGPEIMRQQLAHLAELAALPHVTLQILTFEAGSISAAVGEGFVIMYLDPDPPLVYLESYKIGHYIEDAQQTCRFEEAFETLTKAALSTEESVAMVTKAISWHT